MEAAVTSSEVPDRSKDAEENMINDAESVTTPFCFWHSAAVVCGVFFGGGLLSSQQLNQQHGTHLQSGLCVLLFIAFFKFLSHSQHNWLSWFLSTCLPTLTTVFSSTRVSPVFCCIPMACPHLPECLINVYWRYLKIISSACSHVWRLSGESKRTPNQEAAI